MSEVCRTCLNIITMPYYKVEKEDDSETSLLYKISYIIPEVDLNIVRDPVICSKCHDIVEAMFCFRKKCLQTEDAITKYLSAPWCLKTVVDLKDIMGISQNSETSFNPQENYNNLESESITIKDEHETAIAEETDKTINEIDCDKKTFECDKETFECDKEIIKCDKEVKKHKNYKPHKCELCQKIFTTKYYFIMHMRTHTGEELFKCDVCDKKFTLKSTLNKHMVVHGENRLYKCKFCVRTFKSVESMEVHQNTHTVNKEFQCVVCKEFFYRKSTLTRHMYVHTKEKPFCCPICGKAFNRKTRTREHIINMHKDVDVSTVVI